MRRLARPPVRLLALVVVALLVVGCWVALERGAHGYYTFAPGSAPRITGSAQCRLGSSGGGLTLPGGTPCARLDVPGGKSHAIDGSLYMVDVLVGPATPGEYLLSKLGLLHTFHEGMQLLPAQDVLGSTPRPQLQCQGVQQMAGATSTAAVVALRRLGYQVKENDLGARLYQVEPGSPAATSGMRCNDVVTAVNGAPVQTAEDLVRAIHKAQPGQSVTIGVRRTENGHTATEDLVARLVGTPAIPGQGPAKPAQAFLGVVAESDTTFVFPFDVSIDVGNIGGPSAGLALTLGLLDVLSNGQLTGGHRVAATGTMSLDGSVGEIGGVAQKAVAVRHAGAQLFLVPPQNLRAARSEAGSMKVMAVSGLQQALDDLAAIGGRVPAPTPATPAAAR